VIFTPLLAAYIFNIAKSDEDLFVARLYTLIYIFARIMYLKGYFIGSFVNIASLRVYGFALSFYVYAALAFRNFRIPVPV